uniref:Uncharacterized protein n=1 Tax=Anguilla anguilla TaxID=7936 RepID=A0A0E9WEF7_ANGAN
MFDVCTVTTNMDFSVGNRLGCSVHKSVSVLLLFLPSAQYIHSMASAFL